MQNVNITRQGKKRTIPARLFMIFARESPTAIIFRRGPSRWVQLIKWNTKMDTFDSGQWFHGRIYERRSDLSPDGSLLIYFARGPGAKISVRSMGDTECTHAWTAISRPPFFTALALWPKGDCWAGGGLFKNGRVVLLNHKPEVATPHKEHQPQGLLVIPNEQAQGEDDPIFSQRLDRDGWELKVPWQVEYQYPKFYHTIQPEVREKSNAGRTHVIQLTRSIERLGRSEEFVLRSEKDSALTAIEGASWVDWDQQDRLVFARHGKVFATSIETNGQVAEEQLIDLNPPRPEPVAPPAWATEW